MSEHKTPYSGIEEQTGHEPYSEIQEEEDKRVMQENRSAAEESPPEAKIPEHHEEKEKVKATRKK
jgi:hypothetical protein